MTFRDKRSQDGDDQERGLRRDCPERSEVRRILVDRQAIAMVQSCVGDRARLVVMGDVRFCVAVHRDQETPVVFRFMDVLGRSDWQAANHGDEQQTQGAGPDHAIMLCDSRGALN